MREVALLNCSPWLSVRVPRLRQPLPNDRALQRDSPDAD
jgi:hypothetical protein